MGTKQIETATVIGTVTLAGDAEVILTSARVTGSPLSIAVAVDLADDASAVAGKIRSTMALTAAVSEWFAVSGSGADVVLTHHQALANDATLNIAIDNDTCTGLTAAPTSTNTQAGSGITNGYCTLAELKSRQGINDTSDDDELESVITAVSRWIDGFCHRVFYSETATKYFESFDGQWVHIPDLLSITTLKTDDNSDGVYETTWATSDYLTHPVNASVDGLPYTSISIKPLGRYTFPMTPAGTEITGVFGHTLPQPVKEACLLQSARLWKRKDAVFGVEGSNAMGTVLMMPNLDIDVQALLEQYKRVLL